MVASTMDAAGGGVIMVMSIAMNGVVVSGLSSISSVTLGSLGASLTMFVVL